MDVGVRVFDFLNSCSVPGRTVSEIGTTDHAHVCKIFNQRPSTLASSALFLSFLAMVLADGPGGDVQGSCSPSTSFAPVGRRVVVLQSSKQEQQSLLSSASANPASGATSPLASAAAASSSPNTLVGVKPGVYRISYIKNKKSEFSSIFLIFSGVRVQASGGRLGAWEMLIGSF